MQSKHIDVSYFAAGIVAHLASGDQSEWVDAKREQRRRLRQKLREEKQQQQHEQQQSQQQPQQRQSQQQRSQQQSQQQPQQQRKRKQRQQHLEDAPYVEPEGDTESEDDETLDRTHDCGAENEKRTLMADLASVVARWNTPEEEMVAYRSFRPFLPLLNAGQEPAVQLWAIWAIHQVIIAKLTMNIPFFDLTNFHFFYSIGVL